MFAPQSVPHPNGACPQSHTLCALSFLDPRCCKFVPYPLQNITHSAWLTFLDGDPGSNPALSEEVDSGSVSYHAQCAAHQFKLPRHLLAIALSGSYEPCAAEISERIAWLRIYFAVQIFDVPRLPLEVRLLIADYVLHGDFLSMLALEQIKDLPEPSPTTTCQMPLSSVIWAQTLRYERVEYVSSLGEVPGEGFRLLNRSPSISCLYIGYNSIGVRQVVLSSRQKPPQEMPDTWWEILEVDRNTDLTIETDGFKVRSLHQGGKKHLAQSYLWDCPPVQHVQPRAFPLDVPGGERILMAKFPCDASGYTIYWDLGCKILLPARRVSSVMYDGRKCGIWIYFPLRKDETISQILAYGRGIDFGFLLRTSQGRLALLGPQPKPQRQAPTVTHLASFRRNQGHCYFGMAKDGVRRFACASEAVDPTAELLTIPVPSSPYPRTNLYDYFFHSSVVLGDVTEFRFCRSVDAGQQRIIGILFRSSLGCHAAVGQVRFDSLDTPMAVGKNEVLRLYIAKAQGRRIVTDRCLATSTARSTCFEIKMSGLLEWWTSLTKSLIYHNGILLM
ncbi:uncharacterized protein B0I36DRAFT_395988 [Microdochium trichocladiopsis]|uniref:Uncharacterized protein n=1 Tax=Microdochium trichocladiopsis TaxID=1682393 RepID=A0A9P8XW06_9PEZI|nr:uncharacterized protein B0I36DRAFT_395988 [Microdochium trichocladiopsis]KAH7016116.1 hypothetical protein B0I36DRAFT_395988 [Microdochium trichocladiopsis]